MKNTMIIFGIMLASILIFYALPNTYSIELRGLFSFVLFSFALYSFERLSQKKYQKFFGDQIKTLTSEIQEIESNIEGLKYDFVNFSSNTNKNKELLAEVKVLQTLLSQLARSKGKSFDTPDTPDTPETSTPTVNPARKIFKEAEPFQNFSNEDLSEIVHNALRENRVDLYLQPIVSLPGRKHIYYECFSRVRDRDGKTIFAREYLPLAKESGLISTLDNLLLFRCTQLIRSLGHNKPEVKFFCNISTSSLMDEEFFPQFIDFLVTNKDLKDRLVFEFAQNDILNMDESVEINLLKLGQNGFSFSMDQVESLVFDIPRLSQRFFNFIKVDVDILNNGKGDIHPQDLKEALSRFEIDIIASKIEDEKGVVNVLDLNVDYGQGYLFGEPKLKSKKEKNTLEAGEDIAQEGVN